MLSMGRPTPTAAGRRIHYRRAMTGLSSVGARLMATGMISPGCYAVLTGLALLLVAHVLGSVSPDNDAAALPVAVVAAVAGAWQLQRGVRAEIARRRTATSQRR